LGATAFVMSTAVGVAASAAATTSSVLKAAKAAMAKQTGVHVVDSVKSGSVSQLMIADFGTKSGEETLSEGKERLTVKLTPTYAYFSGNSSGLTATGLTAAQAKKVGKDWISMKAGTSEYASIKSDLTVSALAVLLPATKGTTLSTTVTAGVHLSTVTDGVHLYVLKWTTAATSSTSKLSNTMTISAVGATLPVEVITTAPSGSATTKFSKWGEHVAVSTPPAASTISYAKATS
ncbi:MAG: hypothetical protein ABSC73_04940, partial [Acidimicrobiales bacterium]